MTHFLPRRLLLGIGSVLIGLYAGVAKSQVVPDTTLPNNTVVSSEGCISCEIIGGTVNGNNLFHSFDTFSIEGEAYFNQADTIENIFSRVTGNQVSDINGLIRANGTANLFLLNPNGVMFGSDASLNIGGSFIASTASQLVFTDGTRFSTLPAETNTLLSISTPVGLQFGREAGAIVNASTANLTTDDIGIPLSGGIEAATGQTLAFIGSTVELDGGVLFAPGGAIEIGSVSDNSFVGLAPSNNAWQVSYDETIRYEDIDIFNASYLDTSGDRAGTIQIQGRNVALTESSLIRALTLGADTGDAVNISASEAITLSGDFTALEVWSEDSGSASDIALNASAITIEEGAYIDSQGLIGQAGDIALSADQILISGVDSDGIAGGIFAQAYEDYDGALQGGNISIDARDFVIEEGAQISIDTFGAATTGKLLIT
ncbi:MAG: filamentous hemagglutinin N-terminal domain-containing protein, partial [Cyanobacteria bacterium J06643_4]